MWVPLAQMDDVNNDKKIGMKELYLSSENNKSSNLTNAQLHEIMLRGLEQSQKYTIRVNTVISGKIIASRSETIEAVRIQDENNIK